MSVYETESSRKCLPDLIDAFSHVHAGLDYHIYDNLIKRLHLCTLKLEMICSFLHVIVFATPQLSNNEVSQTHLKPAFVQSGAESPDPQ